MYTLDAQRQNWQILLIDEDDLLELAYRDQVTDEALLYNPETKNFISAKEYALLIGNARGLRMSRASIPLPPVPFAAANPLGKIPMVSKSFDLPSEPHNLGAAPTSLDASPAAPVWKAPLHSHTDDIIESYIPPFRASIRLQILGLLMLPVFGLGLPFLFAGCRRKNHILRLVAQTGMDKPVWINYVSSRVAAYPSEQKAFQMAAAFVSLIAVSAAVGGMSRANVRTGIGQIASDLSASAPHSHQAKRANTASGLHSFMTDSPRIAQ